MYGLDLSKSIADTIQVTPRKFASLTRNKKDRFHDSRRTRKTAAAQLFYDTDFLPRGTTSTVSSTLQHTPIKYSVMKSKKERFPEIGFLQSYVDRDMVDALSKLQYDTDTAHKRSMASSLLYTPRRYASLRSPRPRFPKKADEEGHGKHLGPGSYKNIHPYTSTSRYMTTVGKARRSPRTYSIMRSSTKRFGKNSFMNISGSGSSAMWPPIRPRY